MTMVVVDAGPIAPTEPELGKLAELHRFLHDRERCELKVVAPSGEEVELSESVVRVLRQAVAALARDQVVVIDAFNRDLTIDQIASLVNVPRPYVAQLIERGALPAQMIRAQPRVQFDDVMAYRQTRDAERRKAMTELVRISEELGLYDDDDLPGPARRG